MEQPLSEIQAAIDQILDIKSTISKKRKSKVTKKKDLFVSIVTSIERIINSQNLMYAEFKLDLSEYNEAFLDTIDALIVLHFGKEGAELIAFYLWDRFASDGTQVPYVLAGGQEVILESAESLWDALILMNPNYGQ